MNKYEILKEKLENRSKILGTTLSILNSPLLVEKMNRDDLNFILFDAEHGIFNNENVMQALQVCRLMGLPSFVRVADSEYHLIARAMYMGADGIMLPRKPVKWAAAVTVNSDPVKALQNIAVTCSSRLSPRRASTICPRCWKPTASRFLPSLSDPMICPS